MPTLPPLSLYVHIPWCVRKCPYCDFNSHAADATLPEAEYVEALIAELALCTDSAAKRPLQSIFFGGGTPSLFSPQAIGRVIEAAERLFGFADAIEITLEANPGTTEQQRFSGYRAAGVNRLSLGLQSLNEQHLQALGRIHDRAQALSAVGQAQRAGFDNINIDLMHGLPGQSVADACADLRAGLALETAHLSWYQLTIEPNTEFFKRPPLLPADETLSDIQEAGSALLCEAGFAQYEVSAYARPGREARHNLNYWTFGDYLGVGAGAHGKLTRTDGSIVRTSTTRLPRDYLSNAARWSAEPSAGRSQTVIDREDLPFEFLMNALRLTSGVPASSFTERTGLPLTALEPALSRLRAQQLLRDDPEQLATTPLGFRFLNSVLGEFLD
ncbi:MAG: radical SAM family heme chaperone HemW [Spongiibacteraceae bacterium]|jgi:oxygen-independent coproporphyrinogen-3 oxidase|nr:radical SAM family heme chaperone HemW [Spongiibacteraceae bacterium]